MQEVELKMQGLMHEGGGGGIIAGFYDIILDPY